MVIFRVIQDGRGWISEIGGDPNQKPTIITLNNFSLLIRGDIRIVGDAVVAQSIEIISGNGETSNNWLRLSLDKQSWVDKNGLSSDIQRFEEIVTCGSTLVVIK